MSRKLAFLGLMLLVVLVVAGTSAWAQSDDPEGQGAQEKQEDKSEKPSQKAEKKKTPDELPAVITNDYLNKLFGEEAAEPEEQPAPAAGKPAAGKPATKGAETDKAAAGKKPPKSEDEKAEAEMSPAERQKRIAAIDAELERLDKRKLALRNPLLRGTVPPTESETADEQGMNNIKIIERNEKRIEELKAEKAKLQGQSD